jgi:radical SAM protein with 4Fe4S-binding SPASM domain
MSVKTLIGALDLLLATEHRTPRLSFYGGEPLLCFGLIRRAVEHVERTRRPGLAVRYTVSTNGTLLGRDELEFLARHGVQTQISFDGVPAAQELRGTKTFPLLDRLLRRLRGEYGDFFRERVGVGMVFLPSTVRCLSQGVRYFLDRGVQEIQLSPAFSGLERWQSESITELDREFSLIRDVSLEHYETTGEVPVTLFRKEWDAKWAGAKRGSMCDVANGLNLAVDVDGEVYACEMFANSFQRYPKALLASAQRALKLGKVTASDLGRRLRHLRTAAEGEEIFHRREDKYSTYGKCSECPYFFGCSVCPVVIAHNPDSDDPRRIPDFFCAFNLVSNKYRNEFPEQGFLRRRRAGGTGQRKEAAGGQLR